MIKVKNLIKKFDHHGIAGIHDVSFEVETGQILALMGPNGSGKTTLLKCITKEITPDSGSIEGVKKIKLHTPIVPASDLNVQAYLVSQVALEMDQDKKIQLARDYADIFEFTFQLKQNFGELSSGQAQKVLLASELINRPELLLLDEPFAHLDPLTRIGILQSLFSHLKQLNLTVIWVSHDLKEVMKFSDTLAVLSFGKLEQSGRPLALMQKPRNHFVAQFLGYQNFFPIKFNGSTWLTPWGEMNHPYRSTINALLIVPSSSWNCEESSPVTGVVEKVYPQDQGILCELSWADQTMTLGLTPTAPIPELGALIPLSPRCSDCLVIPL